MSKYENVKQLLNEEHPERYDFKRRMKDYYIDYKRVFDEIFEKVIENTPYQNEELSSVEQFQLYRTADQELNQYLKEVRNNFGKLFDCDSSNGTCECTQEIYELLWGYKKSEHSYYGEIEYPSLAGEYGGDTMNSFQTTYNLLNDNGFLEDNTEWTNEYAKYTHTLGNFTLVPAGFNRARYGKTKDFFDASLAWLKKDGFHDSNKLVFDKNQFNTYINYFYMWDYVEVINDMYHVKSLLNSSVDVEDGDVANNAVWLERLQSTTMKANLLEYMKRVCSYIRRRGAFMTILLRLRLAETEELKQVSNHLFTYIHGKEFLEQVHENGYKKVLDKLAECLESVYGLDENSERHAIQAAMQEFYLIVMEN